MDYLSYETSKIDWCETNYQKSNYIIEYYNSISNIPYILFYLLGYYSTRNIDYSCKLYKLLLLIGICSFYFHATLSLLGQILDELSILILLSNSIYLLYQDQPKICNIIKISTILFIPIMCLYPVINIAALMIYGVIICKIVRKRYYAYIEKYGEIRALYYVYITSQVLFVLSFTIWFMDKFLCKKWIFYYLELHAIWHILIGIVGYTGILLGLFLQTDHRRQMDTYWIIPIIKN
jgi:alkaline ceramidase